MKNHKIRLLSIIALIFAALCMSACTGGREDTPKETNTTSTAKVFPVLNISEGEYSYNYLKAYSLKMSAESMYGPLTPVKGGEAVHFLMDHTPEDLVRIEYVLYEMSGTLIENGTISDKTQFQNGAFDISIENANSSESCLEVKLCFADEQAAYYYTRIVSGASVSDAIAFALDIENACLEKESPVDLTLAMEWDLVQMENSYSTADIHSNYDQVTWGGLEIEDLASDYYIDVVDCVEGIVSLRVSYDIYSGREARTEYRIRDFLRIREYNSENFLLNFYRTTDEKFDNKESNFTTNSIYLGVGNDTSGICTYEDGKKTFFTDNLSLFYFDYEGNRVNTVYSAGAQEPAQYMIDADCFKIYPLTLLDHYFYFMVGGYLLDDFNRYISGISLMRYDLEKNEYETVFLQPALYDPEVVLTELDQLSYMNENGKVYFVRGGQICSYDTVNHQLKEEIKNISIDSLITSVSGGNVAFNKKQDAGEDILVVRNLDNSDEVDISPKDNNCLTPIGFINDDFVYGISDKTENSAGYYSDKQTLIYNVCIVDKEGQLVKEYPLEAGKRVLSGRTNETVIILDKAQRAENGTIYANLTQEQIVSGSAQEDPMVVKKETVVSGKGNVRTLVFERGLKGMPSFSTSTVSGGANEDADRFEPLELASSYKNKYFVYAKGHLYGIYSVMREALTTAETLAGIVTDVNNDKLYYRVAKNKTASILPRESSLATSILDQESGVVKKWQELESDRKVLDISGFTLDDALMFVSRGFPVFARYNADSFVWIIGYTENTITCQNAASNETFDLSLEEAENAFQKAGFEFYTCND